MLRLCADDTLSFLSCLDNSYHVQQKAIASSAQKTLLRRLSHQEQCHNFAAAAAAAATATTTNNNNDSHRQHHLTPEVAKTIFRLKTQGVQVSPKILHHVKKKEAWKAIRRERREQKKANRVPDPVWYDWPDELGMLEMRKLGITETEEEGADEFLCFVEEARPTRRIAVNGIDNAASSVSKGSGSAAMQKRAVNVRKRRTLLKTSDLAASPIQNIAQIWRPRSPAKMENVSPLRHSVSEFRFPWTGKPVVEDSGALHKLKEYENLDEDFGESKEIKIGGTKHSHDEEFTGSLKPDLNVHMDGTNYAASCYTLEKRRCNRIEAGVDDRLGKPHPGTNGAYLGLCTSIHTPILSSSDGSLQPASIASLRSFTKTATKVINVDGNYFSAGKQIRPSKEFHTAGIEKFMDDEIDEVPKGQEVWMKGVGLIKNKKPEFSKEIKEMVIARRKGDWSGLYEDDSESESNAPSMALFDGRAALLEDGRIQRLAARLQDVNYWISKVHFSKIMHSGKMKLTEDRAIRLIQILGEKGNWRRAMQVVQWVHKRQRYEFHISKFIFTTLLSILGKARRPVEAATVFSVMRGKFSSYPDMAAYHALAVTMGQAGQLKELIQLMESLEVGPPQPIKFVPLFNWDPTLHPDIVVYNSVLVACISTKEWAGVTWTWEEIEKKRIKPNGATFGLTIEAMVKANNFNQAIRYYNRMERAGFPPNAQTYKCLVEAFGKAKMTDEAVELVKEMEASGIVANASVYFALACSFCIVGRLKDALVQVRKMQDFSSKKPDVVTYTGLIKTCHEVGRIHDAIFLFKHMQHTCAPNVRTCNEMIKLYGWNGMFEEARKVYEGIKKGRLESCLLFDGGTVLSCDSFTFELMLKAALLAEKWDYFDNVYWDMTSKGYHLSGKTNQWVLLKVARLKKIDIVDDMLQRLRKSGEVPKSRMYEAHILSCLLASCFEKVLFHLNNMRIDGYEVVPTILSLQEHIPKETWDSFIQTTNSLERFSNI